MRGIVASTALLILLVSGASAFVDFNMAPVGITSPSYWAGELARLLPAVGPTGRLPSIFLAHGSPFLIWPKNQPSRLPLKTGGAEGSHAAFLRALGPALLERYRPKALVVFSAHWETESHVEVTDYKTNPLLYDYYGMPKELYEAKWESHGSSQVASRVVSLLQEGGIPAKTITKGRGLDHGVFVPFILMFPEQPFPIPVIEVSMPTLNPAKLLELGKALAPLRDEGVLIISGGLTVHTFEDWSAWEPETAHPGYIDLHNNVLAAASKENDDERKEALLGIPKHPFFRKAHPREEHFVPLYVAAGAGAQGKPAILCDIYGIITAAFGAQ